MFSWARSVRGVRYPEADLVGKSQKRTWAFMCPCVVSVPEDTRKTIRLGLTVEGLAAGALFPFVGDTA